MSTVTEIATQIATILDGLADIDRVSLSSYLPVATTRRVGLILPPLGLRGSVGAPVGLKTKLTTRIPCELWVRVENGARLGDCMTRGRDICLMAAAELQATETQGSALNGTVDYLGDGDGSDPFDWQVDDNMITIGNSIFIRATLFVTVTQWVVLQA